MMRVSIVLALAASCSGAGVVRSKNKGNLHYNYKGDLIDAAPVRGKSEIHYDYLGRPKTSSGKPAVTTGSVAVSSDAAPKSAATKPAAEDKSLSTGFNGAEDLPTIANPKQVSMGSQQVTSSTPAKAGASGPTFHNDDGNSEHPNVVDKVQYDTNPVEEQESGSSLPMFLFLLCGGGVIAKMYTTEESRSQAKDKATATMRMMGPLVQEAMGAMGTVVDSVKSAPGLGHIQNASWHTRFLNQPSYQKVGSTDDDDDLMVNEEDSKADDQYASPLAGMESSFFDDEEPAEVPALMEQKPPLDLFDDCSPAPVPLDLMANEPALLEFGQPQTMDSLGLLDTETDTCGFDL